MIPADAWPKGDRIEWWDDATRTYYDFFNETSRPYTPAEVNALTERIAQATEEANRAALRDRTQAALLSNRDFLALTAPTAAQVGAQVKALTRQVSALIRLELDALDATD